MKRSKAIDIVLEHINTLNNSRETYIELELNAIKVLCLLEYEWEDEDENS
jgi:hypothetical protein